MTCSKETDPFNKIYFLKIMYGVNIFSFWFAIYIFILWNSIFEP